MDPVIKCIRLNSINDFLALDPETFKDNVYSYLKMCAVYGRFDMAKILCTYAYNINWNFLMRLAVASNQLEMVGLFIENGANVSYLDNHAVKIACCNGFYPMLEYLLDKGANITVANNYCVQVAAGNGFTNIIELLIKHGADICANNNHALWWAHINGHNETVKYLIDRGANQSRIENIAPTQKYITKIKTGETSFWLERKIHGHNLPLKKQGNSCDTQKLVYEH